MNFDCYGDCLDGGHDRGDRHRDLDGGSMGLIAADILVPVTIWIIACLTFVAVGGMGKQ